MTSPSIIVNRSHKSGECCGALGFVPCADLPSLLQPKLPLSSSIFDFDDFESLLKLQTDRGD